MKTKIQFLIIALFAVTLFSCSEDDDLGNKDNEGDFIISRSHNGVFDGEYGGTGEMTVNCNYSTDNLQIDQIVVKYDIGYFLGDVTWKSVIKWEGEGGIYQLKWAAQVLDAEDHPVQLNGQNVYCYINGGTFPEPGEGYGWDVTGSPYWDKVFKFYDSENKELVNGISAEDAKAIYKADFVLGNIMILEINEVKL